jgi:hypothetical protein
VRKAKRLRLPHFFFKRLFKRSKMQIEVWKDIPNFKGIYQISNHGNVKSKHFNNDKLLKLNNHGDGYLSVTLYNNGFKKVKLVHHLVAECFLNHIPNGLKIVIDHIDDDPKNNNVNNLQIVTQRYNVCKTQGKYSSKYKGVFKSGENWKSQIVVNKKIIYLGTFKNEFDAHLAYVKKLIKISQ